MRKFSVRAIGINLPSPVAQFAYTARSTCRNHKDGHISNSQSSDLDFAINLGLHCGPNTEQSAKKCALVLPLDPSREALLLHHERFFRPVLLLHHFLFTTFSGLEFVCQLCRRGHVQAWNFIDVAEAMFKHCMSLCPVALSGRSWRLRKPAYVHSNLLRWATSVVSGWRVLAIVVSTCSTR